MWGVRQELCSLENPIGRNIPNETLRASSELFDLLQESPLAHPGGGHSCGPRVGKRQAGQARSLAFWGRSALSSSGIRPPVRVASRSSAPDCKTDGSGDGRVSAGVNRV